MNILLGVLLVLAGLGLVLASGPLAEATTRSNVAFTRGRAFAGPGWEAWNRFIYRLVGAAFMLFGLGAATGFLD